MPQKNPIVEIYKGVEVRKYNRVQILLGEIQFKKILDEVSRTGLSIPKVLAYSSKPCERCKDMMVIAFDKDGNEQMIKRGILSLHIPEGNGANILIQAKNRNAESTNVIQVDP